MSVIKVLKDIVLGYKWIFFIAFVLHASLLFYGFADNWTLINITHDRAIASTALDLISAAAHGPMNFLVEYTRIHDYPLLLSIVAAPFAMLAFVGHWLVAFRGTIPLEMAAYDGIGLAYIIIRFFNLTAYFVGAFFLILLARDWKTNPLTEKLCVFLYLFSPTSFVLLPMERPHLVFMGMTIPLVYVINRFASQSSGKKAVWLGLMTGGMASLSPYGFAFIVSAAIAPFVASSHARALQARYSITVLSVATVVAVIFGYPQLLLGLNDVRGALLGGSPIYVSFAARGLTENLLGIWSHEPLLVISCIVAIFATYKNKNHFGRNVFVWGIPLLVLLPLIIFQRIFLEMNLGIYVSLLILFVLYSDTFKMLFRIAKTIDYSSVFAGIVVVLIMHTFRPGFVLAYEYLDHHAQEDDLVLDVSGLTSYLDTRSADLTSQYNTDFDKQKNTIRDFGLPYERFHFIFLKMSPSTNSFPIIEKEHPRFVVMHPLEPFNVPEYMQVMRQGGRWKVPRIVPLVSIPYPGRAGVVIYEKNGI